MSDLENPQHLDPETVEDYFRLGARSAFPLHDRPAARLVIDPARNELQLLTPTGGSDPDVTAYERINLRRVRPEGMKVDWYELTVDASDMHYEAYVLVESIVDQMRSGASFRHAVSESLESLKDLLASRKRLTEETIVGMLGELLVLQWIVEQDGEDDAIAAWLGPLAEEHDFGLPGYDAEVKTTKSEGRVHVIGSETQLTASPGRPLYLISVQVTRAGASASAFTLPDLIGQVRTRLRRTRRTFDSALEGLGWRDEDSDLYRTRFEFRSAPRAYAVDSDFPAITSALLDSVVPQRSHVVGITYRIDVTHLSHSAVPAPLDQFCEDPK